MPTMQERHTKIDQIRQLPTQLEAVVAGLSVEDLTTPYLDNEWTVAQNIHHLADGHMTCFLRMKHIATEKTPILKPYDGDAWVLTADCGPEAVPTSLALIKAIHERWCSLLESFSEADWARTGMHLEAGKITLDDLLNYYSKHGTDHIDQIQRTLAAKGKSS